ncbi:MAG: hypothetical protein AAF629_18545 [Chloroflexota bacterium]
MSNNQPNESSTIARILRNWPWFIGGGTASILAVCSILLFVVAFISGSLNLFLFWRLNEFQVQVVAPVPTDTPDSTSAAIAGLLNVVTATPVPTNDPDAAAASESTLPIVTPTSPITELVPVAKVTSDAPSIPLSDPEPADTPVATQEDQAPSSSSEEPQFAIRTNSSSGDGLQNGDFETFQAIQKDGEDVFWKDKYPEQVGENWNVNVISEAKKNKIHLLSSPTFGQVAKDLYNGNGSNYAYGGGNSQVIISQYGYDVVLYQTFNVEPGKTYNFNGLIVSYYKGTDNPATPDKIFKRIGIDPTGGQDYESASVVWGDWIDKDHAWIDPSIETQAIEDAMTVFIQIENKEENVGATELNIVHIDKFKLE